MKVKLRLVQLSNGEYAVQVKGRTWFDFFWGTLSEFRHLASAREHIDALTDEFTQRRRKGIASVIEERTI